MLSVSRVHNSDDRMINGYEVVDGVRIGMGNKCTQENLPQCYSVYHKPHMTQPRTEPGSPWWSHNKENYNESAMYEIPLIYGSPVILPFSVI
jgi:hypothetical protein